MCTFVAAKMLLPSRPSPIVDGVATKYAKATLRFNGLGSSLDPLIMLGMGEVMAAFHLVPATKRNNYIARFRMHTFSMRMYRFILAETNRDDIIFIRQLWYEGFPTFWGRTLGPRTQLFALLVSIQAMDLPRL